MLSVFMAGNMDDGVERDGWALPSIELSSSAPAADDEGSVNGSVAKELGRTV